MDFFEQIAREQVRAMILNNARREDLSQVFSQGEMRLLGCLHAGADGRTAGELSMLLELSTARIAAMLNNLERKGAITRARDKADRRRVVVRLTVQGREEVQTSYDAAVACLAEVYRRMGEDDTRELLRLSDRAGEIAQQIYEERKGDVTHPVRSGDRAAARGAVVLRAVTAGVHEPHRGHRHSGRRHRIGHAARAYR